MSSQRKRYLQLAKIAKEPRSKLFYQLIADVAPVVNGMAIKNLNQHGASVIYEVMLRTAASIVVELEFNLTRGSPIDVERVTNDFKLMMNNCIKSQEIGGVLPVPPKMDG